MSVPKYKVVVVGDGGVGKFIVKSNLVFKKSQHFLFFFYR